MIFVASFLWFFGFGMILFLFFCSLQSVFCVFFYLVFTTCFVHFKHAIDCWLHRSKLWLNVFHCYPCPNSLLRLWRTVSMILVWLISIVVVIISIVIFIILSVCSNSFTTIGTGWCYYWYTSSCYSCTTYDIVVIYINLLSNFVTKIRNTTEMELILSLWFCSPWFWFSLYFKEEILKIINFWCKFIIAEQYF